METAPTKENKLYIVVDKTYGGIPVPYILFDPAKKPVYDVEDKHWIAEIEMELTPELVNLMPYLKNMEPDQILEIEIKPIQLTKMVITFEPQKLEY